MHSFFHRLHGFSDEAQTIAINGLILDGGCGTGMLMLETAGCVGQSGHVEGPDSGPQQLIRACNKAARRFHGLVLCGCTKSKASVTLAEMFQKNKERI